MTEIARNGGWITSSSTDSTNIFCGTMPLHFLPMLLCYHMLDSDHTLGRFAAR